MDVVRQDFHSPHLTSSFLKHTQSEEKKKIFMLGMKTA